MNGVLRVLDWTKSHIKIEIKKTEKAENFIQREFLKNKNGAYVTKDSFAEIKNDKIILFTTHLKIDSFFAQLF